MKRMVSAAFVLTIALIIFGPRKLPELGRSLGKSLSGFKRASNELRNTLDEEIRMEEQRNHERTRTAEPARATSPDDHARDETVARKAGEA